LLEADNRSPVVMLVARPGLVDVGELAEQARGADATRGHDETRLSPYAVPLRSGDPAGMAAVRDGRAAVQDEGSQLVALALAAVPLGGTDSSPVGRSDRATDAREPADADAPERWMDLCAGPGGKA